MQLELAGLETRMEPPQQLGGSKLVRREGDTAAESDATDGSVRWQKFAVPLGVYALVAGTLNIITADVPWIWLLLLSAAVTAISDLVVHAIQTNDTRVKVRNLFGQALPWR